MFRREISEHSDEDGDGEDGEEVIFEGQGSFEEVDSSGGVRRSARQAASRK